MMNKAALGSHCDSFKNSGNSTGNASSATNGSSSDTTDQGRSRPEDDSTDSDDDLVAPNLVIDEPERYGNMDSSSEVSQNTETPRGAGESHQECLNRQGKAGDIAVIKRDFANCGIINSVRRQPLLQTPGLGFESASGLGASSTIVVVKATTFQPPQSSRGTPQFCIKSAKKLVAKNCSGSTAVSVISTSPVSLLSSNCGNCPGTPESRASPSAISTSKIVKPNMKLTQKRSSSSIGLKESVERSKNVSSLSQQCAQESDGLKFKIKRSKMATKTSAETRAVVEGEADAKMASDPVIRTPQTQIITNSTTTSCSLLTPTCQSINAGIHSAVISSSASSSTGDAGSRNICSSIDNVIADSFSAASCDASDHSRSNNPHLSGSYSATHPTCSTNTVLSGDVRTSLNGATTNSGALAAIRNMSPQLPSSNISLTGLDNTRNTQQAGVCDYTKYEVNASLDQRHLSRPPKSTPNTPAGSGKRLARKRSMPESVAKRPGSAGSRANGGGSVDSIVDSVVSSATTNWTTLLEKSAPPKAECDGLIGTRGESDCAVKSPDSKPAFISYTPLAAAPIGCDVSTLNNDQPGVSSSDSVDEIIGGDSGSSIGSLQERTDAPSLESAPTIAVNGEEGNSRDSLDSIPDPPSRTLTPASVVPQTDVKVEANPFLCAQEANVRTVGTSVEPGNMGACEPGTQITLNGVTWLDSPETGLTVVNVSWRGRNYVGTLMDATVCDAAMRPLAMFGSSLNRLCCRPAMRGVAARGARRPGKGALKNRPNPVVCEPTSGSPKPCLASSPSQIAADSVTSGSGTPNHTPDTANAYGGEEVANQFGAGGVKCEMEFDSSLSNEGNIANFLQPKNSTRAGSCVPAHPVKEALHSFDELEDGYPAYSCDLPGCERGFYTEKGLAYHQCCRQIGSGHWFAESSTQTDAEGARGDFSVSCGTSTCPSDFVEPNYAELGVNTDVVVPRGFEVDPGLSSDAPQCRWGMPLGTACNLGPGCEGKSFQLGKSSEPAVLFGSVPTHLWGVRANIGVSTGMLAISPESSKNWNALGSTASPSVMTCDPIADDENVARAKQLPPEQQESLQQLFQVVGSQRNQTIHPGKMAKQSPDEAVDPAASSEQNTDPLSNIPPRSGSDPPGTGAVHHPDLPKLELSVTSAGSSLATGPSSPGGYSDISDSEDNTQPVPPILEKQIITPAGHDLEMPGNSDKIPTTTSGSPNKADVNCDIHPEDSSSLSNSGCLQLPISSVSNEPSGMTAVLLTAPFLPNGFPNFPTFKDQLTNLDSNSSSPMEYANLLINNTSLSNHLGFTHNSKLPGGLLQPVFSSNNPSLTLVAECAVATPQGSGEFADPSVSKMIASPPPGPSLPPPDPSSHDSSSVIVPSDPDCDPASYLNSPRANQHHRFASSHETISVTNPPLSQSGADDAPPPVPQPPLSSSYANNCSIYSPRQTKRDGATTINKSPNRCPDQTAGALQPSNVRIIGSGAPKFVQMSPSDPTTGAHRKTVNVELDSGVSAGTHHSPRTSGNTNSFTKDSKTSGNSKHNTNSSTKHSKLSSSNKSLNSPYKRISAAEMTSVSSVPSSCVVSSLATDGSSVGHYYDPIFSSPHPFSTPGMGGIMVDAVTSLASSMGYLPPTSINGFSYMPGAYNGSMVHPGYMSGAAGAFPIGNINPHIDYTQIPPHFFNQTHGGGLSHVPPGSQGFPLYSSVSPNHLPQHGLGAPGVGIPMGHDHGTSFNGGLIPPSSMYPGYLAASAPLPSSLHPQHYLPSYVPPGHIPQHLASPFSTITNSNEVGSPQHHPAILAHHFSRMEASQGGGLIPVGQAGTSPGGHGHHVGGAHLPGGGGRSSSLGGTSLHKIHELSSERSSSSSVRKDDKSTVGNT